MRVAIIQGTNNGFFPAFFRNLKSAIEKKDGNKVQLILPNTRINKESQNFNQKYFGLRTNGLIHRLLFKLTGRQDCWSISATLNLLLIIKRFNPDVIHIHVIDRFLLNYSILFSFIDKYSIPVVWTFHDCRLFTGGCAYFDEIHCEKWKTGCYNCPVSKANTAWQWKYRKKWLGKLNNFHIVTPSLWLKRYVLESFLSNNDISLIYNGINIDQFATQKSIYQFPDSTTGKKVILGCAIHWESRKGIDAFIALSGMLPPNYQIVLIGDIEISKRESIKSKSIITTGRTKTKEELISWYQRAAVFVNPTLADNFPTTNIEALASGTPIVTYNTGGSVEAIDEDTGIVVEQGNIQQLKDAIITIVEHPEKYTELKCKERSKLFSLAQFDKYLELYENIVK